VRELCHNWESPFSASGRRALKSPTSARCPPLRLLRDGALGADLQNSWVESQNVVTVAVGWGLIKPRNLTGPAGKSLPANRFIRLNMALDTSHVGPLLQLLRLNIPHTISPDIVRSFGDDRWKNHMALLQQPVFHTRFAGSNASSNAAQRTAWGMATCMKREPFASSYKILLLRAVRAAVLKSFILSAAWQRSQGLQVRARRVEILSPASAGVFGYVADRRGQSLEMNSDTRAEAVCPPNTPCDCYGQCEHHVAL